MKTLTLNMFAETNEDLPIISGVALTDVTIDKPQWADDGMTGHYLGCKIIIENAEPWRMTLGFDPIYYRATLLKDSRNVSSYTYGLQEAQ
jgi:hypothetical protein